MYTNQDYNEDLRILNKAKKRIRHVLIVCAAAVCLYPAAVFMLLEQPLFRRPDFFNLFYLGSMLLEMVVWLILFYFASTGAKASRPLFRLGILAELGLGGYLIYDMFRQMNFAVVYLAWVIMLLVKIFFLWRLSIWLYDSYWARIYFDHVLVLPASMKPKRRPSAQTDPARPASRPQPVVTARAQADFESPRTGEAQTAYAAAKEESMMSAKYPRSALRILITVLAEMMIFPIIVHLFANTFASIDNSTVFADNMEFTYCIVTTVIWMIPVFFLYLKSPGCRKALWFTLAAQLLVIAFEIWSVWSTSKSSPIVYSARVYLQFAIVEVARYAILLIGVGPAFRLPEIHESYDDSSSEQTGQAEQDVHYEIQMEPHTEEVENDEPSDDDDEEEPSFLDSMKSGFRRLNRH